MKARKQRKRRREKIFWLRLVVRGPNRPESMLRSRRVAPLWQLRLWCVRCAKATAKMQPGMCVPFAMDPGRVNNDIYEMKINKLSGVDLMLSGIITSHVLTLCESFISDASAVCSLSEHWCAGNDNTAVNIGKAIFFGILAIAYVVRRIYRSRRPSNSDIENEMRQSFENEQAKIKAEEEARLREEERQRSLCPQCQGRGMGQNGILCPSCHGKGVRREVVCGVCEGRGVNSAGSICPNCGGRGQCFEN